MDSRSPHEILAYLKEHGIMLRARNGKVLGPRGMDGELKKLISENRDGLLVALTYQCTVCDSPVRVFDREPRNYWVLECVNDPLHYSEVLKKREGVLGLNVPLEETIESPLQAEMGW